MFMIWAHPHGNLVQFVQDNNALIIPAGREFTTYVVGKLRSDPTIAIGLIGLGELVLVTRSSLYAQTHYALLASISWQVEFSPTACVFISALVTAVCCQIFKRRLVQLMEHGGNVQLWSFSQDLMSSFLTFIGFDMKLWLILYAKSDIYRAQFFVFSGSAA